MAPVTAPDPAASPRWRVARDVDEPTAAAVLATDRLWAGYSLADLEPPFRAYSAFDVAAREGAEPEAACLFLRHPAFNATIPHGGAAGLAAILASADLPRETFLLARAEHWPVLERYFALPGGFQAMTRMAVSGRAFRPAEPIPNLRHLTLADAALVRQLYARYPANAFNDDQLATGAFFGAFDPRGRDTLVAIAGAHAISRRRHIAAVGGVFTLPDARGRGYARALTSAVTAALFESGCADVILNVAEDNAVARRVYERLGFTTHCQYLEARALRGHAAGELAPDGR